MSGLGFELLARDGVARRGRLATAHGIVNTPAFMPVGTQATVKGMTWQAVIDAGAEMVLGNTYHLMLRPGADAVERLGGLHKFSGWRGPILTDSGGYQILSLEPKVTASAAVAEPRSMEMVTRLERVAPEASVRVRSSKPVGAAGTCTVVALGEKYTNQRWPAPFWKSRRPNEVPEGWVPTVKVRLA